MPRGTVRGLVAFVLLMVGQFTGSTASAGAESARAPLPIIFVHGNSGSAQQFETNAMRFASNGFPQNRIFTLEYDTSVPTNDHALVELDALIAKVKARTAAPKVDVLAHSRGTLVMHTWLESPERAAHVNRYVNFDGRWSSSPPGGVPTLAIWGEGDPAREIVGGTNITFAEKSHTEVTTSRAAFGETYEFLLGKKPRRLNVVPEPPNRVTVRGRALNFPANTGIEGGKLTVYQVDPKTGQRLRKKPVYRKTLGASGGFGPFKVDGRARYEFAVARAGDLTIHNYPEPFERDNHFYRVLSAPALAPFLDGSPNHTNVAVTRMREFRGDQSGAGANDALRLNGRNVLTPAIAPRARRVLAVFNLDRGSDGVTDTSAPLAPFSLVSFLTGADIFLPASPDHSETIKVTEKMRDPGGQVKVTNVPNWPSSRHSVSVYFKDYAALKYKFKRVRKCRKVKVKRGKKVRFVKRCRIVRK